MASFFRDLHYLPRIYSGVFYFNLFLIPAWVFHSVIVASQSLHLQTFFERWLTLKLFLWQYILFLLLATMALPIFFIDTIETGDFITLNEETSKHVVQVLRMKPGERVQLTDGRGNILTTEIADDHKKKCTVRVINSDFRAKQNKEVCVAISLLKNASRFEWFLEKATEIGVTEIIPLICDRTEKQHFRFDRMNNILIAAMLQSQQAWLPVLHQPSPFKSAIEMGSYTTKLIAHCEEEQKESIYDHSTANSTQILIGPEGDFTQHEISIALETGYKPVTLGSTRLRTETAGIVAATFLCIK